ncbi:MAG: hypothetical protein ABL894_11090 [Hyphomicrobium sp.]
MHWSKPGVAAHALIALLAILFATAAHAEGPFSALSGRWTGQGRLGFAEGKTENITCRATYFVVGDGDKLEQNIRCASAGAKVEIKGALTHNAGKLTGTWSELIYDKAGELTGDITPNGFRINVLGTDLNATMEIIVRDNRQLVEVHFNSSTLIGLSLLLEKG